VSQYRFVITNAGTVGLAGTLRFDFSKFAAGITNGASVTVFRRAVEGTGAFDPVATTFVPGSTELSVPFAFGEYVFGSSGNTLTSADDQNAPLQFALRQNYPNPFNPSTSIAFSIPTTGRVLLEVYNLLGQKVGTLVNGVLPAGQHLRTFAPTSLSSGIYIYRLEAGASVAVRRMAFVK
jgi:hypothetical protein